MEKNSAILNLQKKRKESTFMIKILSESEKKTAIKEYAGRQKTIRQLAHKYGVSYEIMRRIMVNAGYSNGLKVR